MRRSLHNQSQPNGDTPRTALAGWIVGAAVLGLLAFPLFVRHAPANDLPIGSTRIDEPDPEPVSVAAEPEEDDIDGPQFFDEELPTETESVIYVVDRSSSMSLPTDSFVGLDGNVINDGTRLDYVKTELKRSINTLSSSFEFNVIVYDECVEQWRQTRQQATSQKKAEAMAWIDSVQPWGWTNTGGATSLGLADNENNMVLLLSDGAPNFLDCAQSYVADFETHRRVIREANTQNAEVHTFGIGLDPDARAFLLSVATENRGTFREVD